MKPLPLILFLSLKILSTAGQYLKDESVFKHALQANIGYKERQNDHRFEGFYANEIAGQMKLVSFTYGPIKYGKNVDDIIQIYSPQLLGKLDFQTLGILGRNFLQARNYQVNIELSEGKRQCSFSSAILNGCRIKQDKVGFYGYIHPLTNAPKDSILYIPLYVCPSDNTPEQPFETLPLKIVLITNTSLSQFTWKYTVFHNGQLSDPQKGPAPAHLGNNYQLDAPIILTLQPGTTVPHNSIIRLECSAIEAGTNDQDPFRPLAVTLFVP